MCNHKHSILPLKPLHGNLTLILREQHAQDKTKKMASVKLAKVSSSTKGIAGVGIERGVEFPCMLTFYGSKKNKTKLGHELKRFL